MDHNMVLANIGSNCASVAGHWPFRWSCGGFEAKHVASPDAACPGLQRKPLDAAIGQLIAPYCPGGHHGNNQHTDDANVPSLLAVSMAITMQWYYTARIAWWRRFVAVIKTTKCRHWGSTWSDSMQSGTPMPVDSYISSWKRASVDMLAPNKNRGVTYQTDRNQISKTMGYSVGEVKIACHPLNTRLLLCVFTNNLRKYLSNRT